MKKILRIVLCAAIYLVIFAACASDGNFNPNSEINIVSREAGSGTHDAFIKIIGIQALTTPQGDAADSTNMAITRACLHYRNASTIKPNTTNPIYMTSNLS